MPFCNTAPELKSNSTYLTLQTWLEVFREGTRPCSISAQSSKCITNMYVLLRFISSTQLQSSNICTSGVQTYPPPPPPPRDDAQDIRVSICGRFLSTTLAGWEGYPFPLLPYCHTLPSYHLREVPTIEKQNEYISSFLNTKLLYNKVQYGYLVIAAALPERVFQRSSTPEPFRLCR